ncbi:MAG: hypothetical protein QX189_08455 [Methylococcales bacterium]
MKKITVALVSIAVVTCLSGCASQPTTTSVRAADGSMVTIPIDPTTGELTGVESKNVIVRGANLTLLPEKNPAPHIAYNWMFSLEFKNQIQPKRITVEDVTGTPSRLLKIDDTSPSLQDRIWTGLSVKAPLDGDILADFRSQYPWLTIFKIGITLQDDTVSYLYQAALHRPDAKERMYKLLLLGNPFLAM